MKQIRAFQILLASVLLTWVIGAIILFNPRPATVLAQMPIRPPKIAPVAINFASSGTNTVVTGITGQSICVFGLQYVVAGATNITFQDTASGVFSGAEAMLANGSNTLQLRELNQIPYYVTTLGAGFVINNSNAVQVSGSLWYAPCL